MKPKNVLVTGGAGYCGSILVPLLLKLGHKVLVFDLLYYGYDHLPTEHKNLIIVKGDIRDTNKLKEAMVNIDTVIHLACISNDVSFELDELLSTSINYDAFEPLVQTAKNSGVKRFIYASSSSVYGVSEKKNVTEDHPLVPLTLYNKFKGLCEPILFDYTDNNFIGVVFRPATVCGYAPRQRLDLSVNILTNLAIRNNEITVFGGKQLRPNLHVQDYAELCNLLITCDDNLISNEIFNCGYENKSIMEIAKDVKKVVEEKTDYKKLISLKVTTSDDNRSYHINSDKIKNKLGFVPKRSIKNAVDGLFNAFHNNLLPNSLEDDKYFNIRTMKKINAN